MTDERENDSPSPSAAVSDGAPAGFQRLGTSEARLYGPRGLVVCGHAPPEQEALRALLAGGPFPELKVVFVPAGEEGRTLADLLALPNGHGYGEPPGETRAVVMSGLLERELHGLMSAYRVLRLPRPLWASLTPHSEGWALRALIVELEKDAAEMAARRKQKP